MNLVLMIWPVVRYSHEVGTRCHTPAVGRGLPP